MIYILMIPFEGEIECIHGENEFVIGELQYKHETSVKGLVELLDRNSEPLHAQLHYMSTEEAETACNDKNRWCFTKGNKAREILRKAICLENQK